MTVRLLKHHTNLSVILNHLTAAMMCVAVLLSLLMFTGCGKKGPLHKEEKKGTDTEAHGRDFEKESFLLIGLVPEHRIFNQLDKYEPVAAYLSGKIGRKIRLIIIPDYGNFIDSFISTGMDGAFLDSFTYIIGHHKMGIEALARPEGLDGKSTSHGVIFARKDSGIRTAGDMRHKRIVFVDRATTAGYLLPLVYFKKNGIADYRRYFSEWYLAGTHDDAIYDVLNKEADVGAAKRSAMDGLAKSDSRIGRELNILEVSPEFPEDALCVRKDLDEEVKTALKKALLEMDRDNDGMEVLRRFGVGRFIETTDSDYASLYRYVRTAGIDISNFDYASEK